MPTFVVTIEYIRSMDEVEKHTPDHRALCAKMADEGSLLVSGPFNPRTGGMVIVQAESIEAAVRLFETDPFKTNDIAKYTIREWVPKIGAERLA